MEEEGNLSEAIAATTESVLGGGVSHCKLYIDCLLSVKDSRLVLVVVAGVVLRLFSGYRRWPLFYFSYECTNAYYQYRIRYRYP